MNKTLLNFGLGLALLLLLCLFPLPYGYYTLVRFIAMIVFACMAFVLYEQKNTILCVIAVALVILFQPFLKIPLGRDIWNIVDIIVALALVALWYKNKK